MSFPYQIRRLTVMLETKFARQFVFVVGELLSPLQPFLSSFDDLLFNNMFVWGRLVGRWVFVSTDSMESRGIRSPGTRDNRYCWESKCKSSPHS